MSNPDLASTSSMTQLHNLKQPQPKDLIEVAPNEKEVELLKRRQAKRTEKDMLQELNGRIPFIPDDKDIPKVKTLRLTIEYIRHLQKILDDEMITDSKGSTRPLTIDDFKPKVDQEMKKVNDYASLAMKEMETEGRPYSPAPVKKPRKGLSDITNTHVPPMPTLPPVNQFLLPFPKLTIPNPYLPFPSMPFFPFINPQMNQLPSASQSRAAPPRPE